jgi:hypothetical protein
MADKITTVFFVHVRHEAENRGRTWGFYTTPERAEQAIRNNEGDMFEVGYFDLALIEEISEGIFADVISERWFRATQTGKFVYNIEPIAKPEKYKQVSNFSIG